MAHFKNESVSWIDFADTLREYGYSPADDANDDKLVAYLEMPTGVSTPDTITIIVGFYEDSSEISVEVASESYARAVANGSIKDIFYTFLAYNGTVRTVEDVRKVLEAAEKSANLYIEALKTINV